MIVYVLTISHMQIAHCLMFHFFPHLKVFEAQKAVLDSGRPDVELLLGGTTLLTPNDMFELLLGSSS